MEPFPPFCSINPLNMQTHTKFQLQLAVFSILPIIFLLKGFQFQRSLEPSWPAGLLWLRHITTFSYQNTPGHREQHHVWLSFICSPKTHICIQLGSLRITSWMSHKYGLCSSLHPHGDSPWCFHCGPVFTQIFTLYNCFKGMYYILCHLPFLSGST